LIGCNTCCRSYHPKCLPIEPQLSQLWHCPGCLKREWHIPTPKMSSTTPTTEPEDGKSKFTLQPLPNDLPTLNRATSLAQNFGLPPAGNTECDIAKITKIRPDLTLLRSEGDAALSRVSTGEPWVRLTPGSPKSSGDGASQSYPLPGPLGPADSAATANVRPVIGAIAFELSPQ
jgi:hypothetical protein